jgi:hypothetical protein
MITCKKCKKFVSNVTTEYNKFSAEVIKVVGDCKKHGQVECYYDDFEELGIEE